MRPDMEWARGVEDEFPKRKDFGSRRFSLAVSDLNNVPGREHQI